MKAQIIEAIALVVFFAAVSGLFGCSSRKPVELTTQQTYDCTATYSPERQVYVVNCPDLESKQ